MGVCKDQGGSPIGPIGDVWDIEPICFQELVYDERRCKPRHFIFFDYACRTDSTDVQLSETAEEHTWVTLEEALEMPVEQYTGVVIRERMKRKAG